MMTTYERIREAVSIRERLLLVLSRRQDVRRPAHGGGGDRGGAPGMRGGRGMGGGAGRGAPRGGFSNRIAGLHGGAPKSDDAPAETQSVSGTPAPVVASKPALDPDVAEALRVGSVVVARLAESFERLSDATKARAIVDAIPRLVPAGAARLPIAAAIKEVVTPLLGGRFADAAEDRVAVLRLLHSEMLYTLSKAPDPRDAELRGGRSGGRDDAGRRGRDGRRPPREDRPRG